MGIPMIVGLYVVGKDVSMIAINIIMAVIYCSVVVLMCLAVVEMLRDGNSSKVFKYMLGACGGLLLSVVVLSVGAAITTIIGGM